MANIETNTHGQPMLPTTLVYFTAISYFNNRSRRGGTQVFWGGSTQQADDKASAWRVTASNCELLDEHVGVSQFQNLNQQKEYLD
jgi:hypothetical protein